MRRAAKICTGCLGGLILFGVGLLWFLQSPATARGVRDRLQGVLGAALDRRVEISEVLVIPWALGLDLQRLRVGPEGSAAGPAAVEADRITIRLGIARVLARRIVVRLVGVEGLRVRIPEGPARPLDLWGEILGHRPAVHFELLGMTWTVELARVEVVRGEVWPPAHPGRGLLQDLRGFLAWTPQGTVKGEVGANLLIPGAADRPLNAALGFQGQNRLVEVTHLLIRGGRSSLDGQGAVRFPGREAALDLTLRGKVDLAEIAAAAGAGPAEGRLEVEARLAGPAGRARIVGTGRLGEGGIAGVAFRDLRLRLEGDRESLRLTEAEARLLGGTLRGSAVVSWAAGRHTAEATWQGADLAALLRLTGRTLPVRGTVSGSARVEGTGWTLPAQRIEARFAVPDLRALDDEPPLGHLHGEIRLAGGVILPTLVFQRGRATLRGTGRVGEDRINLALDARFPQMAEVGALLGDPRLGGSATVRGRLTGSPEAPEFSGDLTWQRPVVAGVALRRIAGKIGMAGRRLVASQLVVEAERTRLEIKGQVELTPGRSLNQIRPDRDLFLHLTILSRGRLGEVAALAGADPALPVAGGFTLRGTLEGNLVAPVGRGEVGLQRVFLDNEWVGDLSVQWQVDGRRLLVPAFTLLREGERLTGNGEITPSGDLRLAFSSASLSLGGIRILAEEQLRGTVAVVAEAHGRLSAPEIRGNFTGIDLAYRGVALGDGAGSFALHQARFLVQARLMEGRYLFRCAVGKKAVEPFHADVELRDGDIGHLLRVAGEKPPAGLRGRADGRVSVRVLPREDATAGEAHLSALRFSLWGEAWRSREPVTVTWHGDRVEIRAPRLGWARGQASLTGSVTRGGGANLRIAGAVPVTYASRFVPEIEKAEGTVQVQIDLRGPLDSPDAFGTVAAAEGVTLKVRSLPWELEGAQGSVSLTGAGFAIPALSAAMAGGRLQAAGGGSPATPGGALRQVYDFTLETADADRMFAGLGKPDLITGRLDAQGHLEIAPDGEGLRALDGQVKVDLHRGRIRRFTLLAKVFSLLNPAQLLRFRLPDLTGTGMRFDTLRGGFTVTRGVAETQDLFLDGPSLNISAVGSVDLEAQSVAMKLGVRPLQTVDTVLSKIPLLGHILTGKEKSLIISYYDVTGPLGDPQVRSVPLESLGRGVLGIFRRLLELPAELFRGHSP